MTDRKGGRREKHPRRRIVDAISYLARTRTGCQWRYLPKGFPPIQTVYWYFNWWHDDGTVERVHDALWVKVRQADGRCAEPSAGLIDSQSVRAADTASKSTSGFDAGQKTKGRKRFIVTDALGLLLTVHVLAASVQDRDGSKRSLLWTARTIRPSRRSGPISVLPADSSSGPLPSCTARWRSSARTPDSAASRSSRSVGR